MNFHPSRRPIPAAKPAQPVDPTPGPLRLHPDLPDEALALMSGVPLYGRQDVPFFLPKQKVTERPALVLRPSEAPDLPGRWIIVDRLTDLESLALSRLDRNVRDSTGCAEADRDGAIDAFLAYVDDKRQRVLARVAPDQVPMSALIATYSAHLAFGAHALTPKGVKAYRCNLLPVSEFWGGILAAAVTPKTCRRYEIWRRKQKVKKTTRPISTTQIGHEIGTLRALINHFEEMTPLRLGTKYYVPGRDTPPIVWMKRGEIARYLRACRGRISVPVLDAKGKAVGWRWKVARDDDPSLTGPEGDRIVLRPHDEIQRRKSEARRVVLILFTASRHKVAIDTAYKEEAMRAYHSQYEDVLRRKAIGERDTKKRRPAIPIAPILKRFILNWGRNDALRLGFPPSHIIHKVDGEPWSDTGMRKVRKRIMDDSGLTKQPNSNTLRHTCAMWMKIENVSATIAANFLGCREDVLTERYGTWDPHSMYPAIDALTYGSRQKETEKRLAMEGIED